jgi:hypothetical protein
VNELKKYLVLAIVVLLVLPLTFNLSMGKESSTASADFSYVGRDLTTQGDWLGSRYGDCGYALPYGTPPFKEVAVGETTGIGESAHEYWWREPWSVPGEKYYAYEDYLGGLYILEYNVTGSEGPPRALVDNDTDYYRPSWYGHDSAITVTLTGIAGDYKLAIYLLDWDAPTGGDRRRLRVNVTSSGDSDSADLGNTMIENFAAGVYAVFEVDSDGTIIIEVTKLFVATPYAVIAGIFLDSIPGPLTGVNFVGTDRDTKGNWRTTYGDDYHLLPGFNVPTSDVKYTPIDKAYDVTNIPSGSYSVSGGVFQYAAGDARTYGAYPYIGLYSAYEWVDNSTATALDTRMLMYPEDKIYYGYPPTPLDRRYFGVWDSGELNGLLNNFMIRLRIPEGRYLLSIYAADFEQIGRSETIEIWNEPMTTMLNSQHITAAEINNGIYLQWYVEGPRIINIKAIADQGNLNSLINGIFMNCRHASGKVTGGGHGRIGLNGIPGGSFGFNVMWFSRDPSPKGELQYIDHTTGMKVHAHHIDYLFVWEFWEPNKPWPYRKARFGGPCTIDGEKGYTFEVYVEDRGEPGKADVFQITLSTGYVGGSETEPILRGNIQIHKPPK